MMLLRPRRTAWLQLAALLLVCSAPLRAVVELDIPITDTSGMRVALAEAARAFERIHPGVKVNIYGDPRIADQLRTRIIDGDFPDAAACGNIAWSSLAKAGRLIDLTASLNGRNWEGDARWGDIFRPGSLDNWAMHDGIYGLPHLFQCWVLYYDKAFFREHGWSEPKTWPEYFVLCENIRAAGRAPLSLPGIYLSYANPILFSTFHNLGGATAWQKYWNIEPGVRTDPAFVRAAEVLQRVTTTLVSGWEGMSHTAAQRAFLERATAMNVSGSWMVNEMAGRFPPDFELGVMNFPGFAEGVGDPSTLLTGSEYFFVFATGNPERERLTLDFLRFITSRGEGERIARATNTPLSMRDVALGNYTPQMQAVIELVGRSRGSINIPPEMLQPPGLTQSFADARLALMAGTITAGEFGETLERTAAAVRARAADPLHVEYRHPIAGGLLILVLAAIIIVSIARARGARPKNPTTPRGLHGSGRLRLSVAARFLGPAMLLYAAIVLGPALAALVWAFTQWDGIGERTWVGLFNFKWLLFESEVFWSALRNNFFLVLVPPLFVVPLSLLLAVLLHRGVWGAGYIRAIVLFPNMLGGIAGTLLWMNAYEPNGGLVNRTLSTLGNALGSEWLQGFAAHPWLAADNLYFALIPVYVWLSCGFNLVLYLAAMENIDPQLYEAAEIDGAPRWRQFFAITLPMIWDILAISIVFMVIGGLNAFEMIWLLTSQEPTASVHTLGTLMVSVMFKDFQIGRATAIAVTLFVLVAAASATVLSRMGRSEAEA